jgi:hypothetical protein
MGTILHLASRSYKAYAAAGVASLPMPRVREFQLA